MGFDTIIRNGVKLADKTLVSLQPYVTFQAWLGDDGYGKSIYTDAVQYRALVEPTHRRRRTAAGQELSVKATVTFLRPLQTSTLSFGVSGFQYPGFEVSAFQTGIVLSSLAAVSAAFQYPGFELSAFETGSDALRDFPIDARDVIILPDGTTGPIVHITGPPSDPKTGRPYFAEVWLGA